MRKTLAMIGLPILLGGCSLPPALTAASWAIDGVSYLVSGKSVTDHAISEVAQQDCALFRVVQDREICEDYEIDGNVDGTILSASAVTEIDDPDALAVPVDLASFTVGFGPGTAEAEAVAFDVAPAALAVQPVLAAQPRFGTATPRPRPVQVAAATHEATAAIRSSERQMRGDLHRTLSVIGSFQQIENARGLATREAGLNAQLRTVVADGKTWHRVIVDAPLAEVRASGFDDAWVLRTCHPADESVLCGGAPVQAAFDHLQVASAN